MYNAPAWNIKLGVEVTPLDLIWLSFLAGVVFASTAELESMMKMKMVSWQLYI